MPVTLQNVNVSLSTSPSAPLIEGTAPDTYSTTGFSNTVNYTGRKGCRIALTATTDFTTHEFIIVRFFNTIYGALTATDTLANGGLRIVFIDTSGNYSGFNVWGGDVYGINADGPNAEGMFGVYNPGGYQDTNWYISPSRTPDIQSATPANFASIANIEFSVKTISANKPDMTVTKLGKVSRILVTGTTTFVNIHDTSFASNFPTQFIRTPYYYQSTSQSPYSAKLPPQIGNGSTTTTVNESSFALGFHNTYDKAPTYRTVGPQLLLDNSNTRPFVINQSATDTLTLTDGSIASSAWWQWQLSGSGTATMTRVQFWRFNQFLAAHGTYTDCAWYGGESAIQVGTACSIVRGTVANMVGHGIQITSGAGSYGNLAIAFNNNSTYDIELGSGGAGTYNLSAISVIGSYTLKIRNNSATNAITVAIPSGIAYTTSTAGGTITVSTPPTYQSVIVSGFTAGSRVQIYDTTNSVELFNGTASSGATIVSGSTATWTDTSPAAVSRAIRVRISYVSGATANNFIETSGLTCATTGSGASVTYPVTSVADATYNSNAVIGSGVTQVTFTDAAIDLINCNVAGGSISWKNIYAAFVYWNFTATGIANNFTYISAPDTANYILTSMKIKNTLTGTPLTVIDGFGRDNTGSAANIVDTTGGSIFLTPQHVVPYATGSGVTSGDITSIASAVITAANTTPIASDIKKVKGQTINGTGTAGNPWGP